MEKTQSKHFCIGCRRLTGGLKKIDTPFSGWLLSVPLIVSNSVSIISNMSFGHNSVDFLVGRVMTAVEKGIISYQHLSNDAIREFVTLYFKTINELRPNTLAVLLDHLDDLDRAARDKEAEKRYSRK